MATLLVLHSGGIGWDEIAATIGIAAAVVMFAAWWDRRSDAEDIGQQKNLDHDDTEQIG